jgi:hypothetical protein
MTLKQVRWAIIILGILAPYLGRLPGIAEHGLQWLTSYFGSGLLAVLYFGAFNAICWGAALLATTFYKHARSAWFPGLAAIISSAWMNSTVDLAADAQAALALIFIPFMTLPFTATGWIIGYYYDRHLSNAAT